MVPAEKLPEEFLCTIVLITFEEVAASTSNVADAIVAAA